MKKKILSMLLVMAMILSTFPVSVFASDPVVTDTATKDVFLNVDSDAGYNTTTLAAAVNAEIARLGGANPPKVRISTNSTEIDTTDLSGWNVYDHYDTRYWNQATYEAAVVKPQSQGGYGSTLEKRPYYGMTESYPYNQTPITIANIGTGPYPEGFTYFLKEHIYSNSINGKPAMKFYGYSTSAYADFLYYPASTNSSKNVKFDVDASKVLPHSLKYAGFLVNAGVIGNSINGYLILFEYAGSGIATSLSGVRLYKLNNASLSTLHAQGLVGLGSSATLVQSISAPFYQKSHIELTITSTNLMATMQQITGGSLTGPITTLFNQTLVDTTFGGFGPYVDYGVRGHSCSSTSSFEYSNLEMSLGGQADTSVSALGALQYADYLNSGATSKYFVNILGSISSYNLKKDANYLQLVQNKELNLFTNKDVTAISNYLPAYYADTTNTTLSTLATSIAKYILGQENGTKQTPTATTVTEIIANFYLISGVSPNEVQVSSIKRELIGATNVQVDVHNTSVKPTGADLSKLTYTLTKPDGNEATITMPFTVTNNSANWPVGQYKVTMDYKGSSIPGYSYFTILEDKVTPTVKAVQNGNMVELTFTNTASSGEFGFTSDLVYYMVTSNDSAAKPSTEGLTKITIPAGVVSASVLLEEGQYFHVFLQDEAGNVGYDTFKLTYLPLTTTAPTASDITYGPLSQSILTGGTATYGSNNIPGSFVWNTPAEIPNIGTSKYLVHYAPDNILYVANNHNVSVKVNPATPSITLSNKTEGYTGNPISIDAAIVTGVTGGTVPSGAISYTYYTDISCTTLTTAGNSGASINGGAPIYAGKYYAKAAIAALGNYTSATTAAPGTLTISSKIDTGLSIVSDQIKTYGDKGFALLYTGGNGTGTVTFTSSNPAIASITTDGYVTINAAGSTEIKATKAADGNYNAQSTTIMLTINAKAVTYYITDNNKTYTGTAQYATVKPSVTTLVEGKDYTVIYMKGDTVVSEPTVKDTYTITVSTINDNYSGSATGTLTIGSTIQSELKITGVPVNDIQYNDTFFLSANGGSGTGNVTFSSSNNGVATVDSTSGAVNITGVGSVIITATREADANFNIQTAKVAFTTTPKAINVTAKATDRDYVAGYKIIEVILSTDVESLTASSTLATVRSASAGTDKEVTITGITLSNSNYKPVNTTIYTTVTITPINDIALDIGGDLIKTYDDVDFKLTASSLGTGEVIWSSGDSSVAKVNSKTGVVTITGVGVANITANKQSDGNYYATFASVAITVEPKDIIFFIVNNTKSYTGEAQYATVTPSVSSLEEGVDYKVTYSEENPTDVGEYTITVEIINPNYVGKSTKAILTIQSVDQTYTLEIGGLPSFIEYEDTFALYANGGNGEGEVSWTSDDKTVAVVNSSGEVEIIGVGTATITATKSGDGNYKEQERSVTFTTNQKEISIAFGSTAKTYNGEIQKVNIRGTATKTPLEQIIKLSYVLQADDLETDFRNNGIYNVSAEVNDSYLENYVLNGYTTAVATIAKAKLTITADYKTKIYGDGNPDFSMSYTLLGLDTDEDFNFPTISCTADKTSDLGNYPIELFYDGEHGNDNYDITLQNGMLTVNPRKVTVKWQDNRSYVYNSTEQTVTAIIGNTANDDMVDFTYTGNYGTNVNEYISEIIGISGEKSNNYSLPESGLTKDWNITKATLIVTADDKSIQYKDAVPEYTVTYASFVGTEDTSVLKGELNLTCDYVKDNDIGEFTITPAGWTSSNYDIIFKNGTLTVAQLPITVNASGSTSNIQVNLSPAVSGLTLDKFTIAQEENIITPTAFAENSSGSKYTLAAKMTAATKYTVTINNGNNYLFNTAAFTAIAPSSGGGSYVEKVDENPFTDVKENDWFYNAVQYVNKAGLMVGTSANTFEPNLEISRGMIVTILYRSEGKPEVTKASGFKDVASGTWYTDAAAWSSKNGLVMGYDAETFGPANNITLEQMVAILYRYAKYKGYDVSKTSDLSTYTDAGNISSWALTSVKWAVAEGLMSGTTTTKLSPTDEATRAQVSDILMRFMQNIVK